MLRGKVVKAAEILDQSESKEENEKKCRKSPQDVPRVLINKLNVSESVVNVHIYK